MDNILLSIQADYKQFYKSENKLLIFATSHEKKCYKIKCFDNKCGCEWTQHCDLEDGLTFKEVVKHNDLIEIDIDEFSRLWVECKK